MSSATFDRDDCITADNVEDELKKLKIIEDYDSDEYEHVSLALVKETDEALVVSCFLFLFRIEFV